jgi:hypothetical protein
VSGPTPEQGDPPRKRPWVLPLAIAILLAGLATIYILYPVVQRDIGGTAQRPTPKATPRTTPKPSPKASPKASPTSTPRPKPKPPAPVTHGLKAPIKGLLDRKGMPSAAFYGVIDGFVVNVNWASLQNFPGAQINSGNAIDRAIAQVRQANASGAHLALKVRVFTGTSAPDWAKRVGGPPVLVRDPESNVAGTVGRFWTPAFGQAYQDLENKLAARYDTVPEIREVTISRCMTVYAEPFIRDIQDPTTVANLLGAGYTIAADHLCEQEQIRAHAVWRHTRSDLSFNPFQTIISRTQVGNDEKFTEQMMSYCRQVLGTRCILENNSLRSVSQSIGYAKMYSAIHSRGANITFQTAVIQKVGNLIVTLSEAVSLGAGAVELPSGYQTIGPGAFAGLRLRLSANSRA